MAGTVVLINQGTQTGIANDSVGGTLYQTIKLDIGTVGASNLFSGTLPSITNLAGGTITKVEGGTIQNLISGTINSATAVLNSGTINVATAVITTLPNLPQGSIQVTAGTITGGTIQNLVSGTINSATAVLNSGTINVATAVITTLPNLPQGSINVTAGTVIMTNGTVGAGTIAVSAGTMIMTNGTIGAGTVAISAGTITHGTIDNGTIKLDGRTARNILSYGTTFGGTAAAYATLVGSTAVGAGTSTWINNVSITNPAGNITCLVGFGTALNGTSVLLKHTLGTTSAVGIEKEFPLPVNAGMTNQDLVAYISGAGTIDVNLSYFISA